MRYFLIALFFLASQFTAFGCVCDELDSTNIEDWIQSSDIVLEGEYLMNLDMNDELLKLKNDQGQGSNILFKVTTLIKGQMNSDTIAIVQFSTGSCTQTFELGRTYIVLGRQIKGYECEALSTMEDQDKEPNELPPNLAFVDDNGILRMQSCDQKDEDFWTNITERYLTLQTNLCSSFGSNTARAKLVKTAPNSH